MLRTRAIVLSAALMGAFLWCSGPLPAIADCPTKSKPAQLINDDTVKVGLCKPDSSPSGTQPNGGTSSPDTPCVRSDGTVIPCRVDDFWWYPMRDKYCYVWDLPADSPWWDTHRDTHGNPVGTYYLCRTFGLEPTTEAPYWEPAPLITPRVPGPDPEAAVRTAVASLKLHPPTVGVGAYVYPKYEKWGLGWWVGAPMWLWVDTNDPLQWGTHTITAALGTDSITATITATQVTYTTGDDTPPTICKTPGTPRPWKKDDPLDRHSPTNCEHTYWHTNKLGDVNSRYTVTATVTWNITWTATDGQSGHFSINMTSTDNPTIHVGELYTVRVPDPTPTGPR